MAAGLARRVETASGDFFTDPLPRADVITMGNILHDWNLDRKLDLIRSAYAALPRVAHSSSSRRSLTTPGATMPAG